MVKEGDSLEVMVLDVDPGERRIALSIKAARDGTGDYRAYMHDNTSMGGMGGTAFDALKNFNVADEDGTDSAE